MPLSALLTAEAWNHDLTAGKPSLGLSPLLLLPALQLGGATLWLPTPNPVSQLCVTSQAGPQKGFPF